MQRGDEHRSRRGRGEGGLWFDAKNNRWEATVVGVDLAGGKTRQKVRARTKTEILAKMRDARKLAEANVKPGAGAVTVGAFLDAWLATVVDGRVSSDNTRTNYKQIVDRHLKPALGTTRIDRLTPEQVDRFLADRAKAGLSRSHVGRMRTLLADALRHAQRRGMVTRNAAELAVMPRTEQPIPRRSLTQEEARRLRDAARGERLEALFVVGLCCGLRPGELCGLLWADIDLDATPPTLTVSGSLKRTTRPDGKGYDLALGAVKRSSNGRRTIELPPVAVETLKAHRAAQDDERANAGPLWEEHGLVFCAEVVERVTGPVGGTPLDPSNVRRTFARVAKKAGIDITFPYVLRHTAASLLIDRGAGIEQVADLLGDDPRTLLRYYRHTVRPVASAGLAMQDVLVAD